MADDTDNTARITAYSEFCTCKPPAIDPENSQLICAKCGTAWVPSKDTP